MTNNVQKSFLLKMEDGLLTVSANNTLIEFDRNQNLTVTGAFQSRASSKKKTAEGIHISKDFNALSAYGTTILLEGDNVVILTSKNIQTAPLVSFSDFTTYHGKKAAASVTSSNTDAEEGRWQSNHADAHGWNTRY
jgi:hypothetical protein